MKNPVKVHLTAIIPIKQHVFKRVLVVISASSAWLQQHTEMEVIQVLKGKAVKSNKYLNKASVSEQAEDTKCQVQIYDL